MMAGMCFLIHHISKLPGKGSFTTKERPLRAGSVWREALSTSLRLTAKNAGDNFLVARIIHKHGRKKGDNGKEKWFFRKEIEFHEFIIVKEFPAYYSKNDNLFVTQGESGFVKEAIDRLNKDLPGSVSLWKVSLDLEAIYRDILAMDPDTEVSGAWFRRKDRKNINSQAAFGNEIGQTIVFDRMARNGTPTNLSLSVNFSGISLRISISSIGSVYFYNSDYPLAACLGVIKLLAPHSTPIPPKRKRG